MGSFSPGRANPVKKCLRSRPQKCDLKNHAAIFPKSLQNDHPEVSGRLSEPPWVSEPSRDLIFSNFEIILGSNLGAKSVKKQSAFEHIFETLSGELFGSLERRFVTKMLPKRFQNGAKMEPEEVSETSLHKNLKKQT